MGNDQKIRVIEFRNYLLRPGTFGRFRDLFDREFVDPMTQLGGITLGQYKIENDSDRFVWIRGFENMKTRLRFLNDFYLESDVWNTYKNEANSMIVNSDNVHLLRPIGEDGVIEGSVLKQGETLVVDFYVCNGQLEQAVDLFKTKYLAYIRGIGVQHTLLWTSEMTENLFTRHPAFQDRNLLVMMNPYRNGNTYMSMVKNIDSPEAELKNAMLENITTRHRLVLTRIQNTNGGGPR